jgi:hypothetical protein
VEVRHLVGAAGEALDVRHEGLQGLHQCRRPRRCRCLRLRRRGRLFFSAAAAERCWGFALSRWGWGVWDAFALAGRGD